MRRSVRSYVAGLATVGIALSSMLLSSGTASASDNMPGKPPSSCSGSLVHGFPLTKKVSSANTLKLYVYYSSAHGGTNCAIARKSGSWAGRSTFLSVTIWRDNGSSESVWPYAAWDQGNYRSYAGAAYITGTNGKCIDVIADYGLHKDDFDGNMGKFHFACG
jgi:hypothetical protein